MAQCPNCGASVESSVCEYCGTFLIDAAVVELAPGKKFWLKLRDRDGNVDCFMVALEYCEIQTSTDFIYDTPCDMRLRLKMALDVLESPIPDNPATVSKVNRWQKGWY